MIILSRRDTKYVIEDVMLTVQDGATIQEMADALRCFLLACGYHHSLVELILPEEE
jgi:hypothetical protein